MSSNVTRVALAVVVAAVVIVVAWFVLRPSPPGDKLTVCLTDGLAQSQTLDRSRLAEFGGSVEKYAAALAGEANAALQKGDAGEATFRIRNDESSKHFRDALSDANTAAIIEACARNAGVSSELSVEVSVHTTTAKHPLADVHVVNNANASEDCLTRKEIGTCPLVLHRVNSSSKIVLSAIHAGFSPARATPAYADLMNGVDIELTPISQHEVRVSITDHDLLKPGVSLTIASETPAGTVVNERCNGSGESDPTCAMAETTSNATVFFASSDVSLVHVVGKYGMEQRDWPHVPIDGGFVTLPWDKPALSPLGVPGVGGTGKACDAAPILGVASKVKGQLPTDAPHLIQLHVIVDATGAITNATTTSAANVGDALQAMIGKKIAGPKSCTATVDWIP